MRLSVDVSEVDISNPGEETSMACIYTHLPTLHESGNKQREVTCYARLACQLSDKQHSMALLPAMPIAIRDMSERR